MYPELAFGPRRPPQPQRENPEQDHKSAADECELVTVGGQSGVENIRAGAENDKDGREAEHEEQAEPERAGSLLHPPLHGFAGDV